MYWEEDLNYYWGSLFCPNPFQMPMLWRKQKAFSWETHTYNMESAWVSVTFCVKGRQKNGNAVGTPKPVGIHAFSSFPPLGKAHNRLQLSGILENHWGKQSFCGVGKNDKAILAWRSHGIHWNPFKTIGETSRYTRSHWMIIFPAFCGAMANYSYRKPLEPIGKSNVSALWAQRRISLAAPS